MKRFARTSSCGVAAAFVLVTRLASAQPTPATPVVGGAAPPPPAAPAAAGAATAIAGVTPVYVEKPSFDASGRKQGWIVHVNTNGTMSFANNSNVVGQVDGSSYSFGLKFNGSLDYNHEKHEWRNTLGVLGSITRTPVINTFVKTSDNLAFDTIYLFHAVPWFGPFAKASFNTSMFRGTDIRPAGADYVITHLDGSVETRPKMETELPLSDPFKPFTLKESVGVFVQPYASDPVTVELRGGAGGQEVFANGQYAVQPSPAAMPGMLVDPLRVDVKQLQDVQQLGAELALSVWGGFMTKKITYRLNADAMTPFVHSALPAGDTRGPFALTNIQVDGTVSFHLVEWASVDYQLKAIRQPQVLDAFQVQNTLLLTFGMTYTNQPPPPPAPPAPK